MIVLTPVKEDPAVFHAFLEGNKRLLLNSLWLVADSGGGCESRSLSEYYGISVPMEEARRFLIEKTRALGGELVLNLDSDVLLPESYVDEACALLADPAVGAISSFFLNKQHSGVLEFGCSIWRKSLLASLYDWNIQVNGAVCECVYMWRKLNAAGFKVLNLTRKPIHIEAKA
jgi:hypothetical protein